MRKIELVIHDWNGSLLNDVSVAYQGVMAIFREFGLEPPSFDEYRNEVPPDIVSFYHSRGVPKEKTLADLNKIFKPVIEANWNVPDLSLFANSLIRCCEIKNIRQVLITMESEEILKRRLQQFKLENKFDPVFTRAYDKAAKIKIALEKFGVKPESAFSLGDTVGDIEAGKKAGVVTIGYTQGYNSRNKLETAKPDYLVDSLWDVVLWLCEDNPSINTGGERKGWPDD